MATERIETTILRNLLHNEEYYRKVVPFLKAEYYENYHEKIVYEEIADFAACLLYTSPSPRDQRGSRMPSSA